MFDISDELRSLVAALDENQIDYALCGGMAMAVHGHLRMTIDTDLLVLSESLDSVFAIAKSFGYNVKGKDRNFADGVIEIDASRKSILTMANYYHLISYW